MVYPAPVIHIDWNMKQICQDEFCNDNGCAFDECGPEGCVELTASDGSICSFNHPENSSVPYLFDSTMMETQGSVPVALTDISHVEWVQGGQTATPWWTELSRYWYMTYDTGLNMLAPKDNWGPTNPVDDNNSIYFNHFTTLVGPIGIHDFIVHFSGTDQTIPLQFNVNTLQVMPIVSAQSVIDQTVCKKVKKNRDRDDDDDRKKVKRKKCFSTEVVVDNLKAKVITSNHGTERLLIQWNEPDEAMILTPPVRLRIFVGNGWIENPVQGGTWDYHFLWMDAPLHGGSVVVPSEQWEWIKQEMRDKGLNSVEIGGQYREQRGQWPMSTYHNRGYIEGIRYTFE